MQRPACRHGKGEHYSGKRGCPRPQRSNRSAVISRGGQESRKFTCYAEAVRRCKTCQVNSDDTAQFAKYTDEHTARTAIPLSTKFDDVAVVLLHRGKTFRQPARMAPRLCASLLIVEFAEFTGEVLADAQHRLDTVMRCLLSEGAYNTRLSSRNASMRRAAVRSASAGNH